VEACIAGERLGQLTGRAGTSGLSAPWTALAPPPILKVSGPTTFIWSHPKFHDIFGILLVFL
jgi:hypothetical protein